MKVLCSSDLHGDRESYLRFASVLASPDYVAGVLAGDLIDEYPSARDAIDAGLATDGDFGDAYDASLTLEDLDRQIATIERMRADPESMLARTLLAKRDELIRIVSAARKPVFIVLGNHDPVDWPTDDFIINVHGVSRELRGYTFVGYRYTVMERTEEEIQADLEAFPSLGGSRTVLVTHSPPFGVGDTTHAGTHIGSKAIRRFVERLKPALHVFGHVHESAGGHGRHLNASSFGHRRLYSVRLPDL